MRKGWIQHPITHELIERDKYVRPKELQHAIFDDYKPFVSPIDGSVIGGRRDYAEHCKKHGVVNAAEFDSHWDKKAQERARVYNGESSRQEAQARKERLNEIWNHVEAKNQ